MRVKPHAVRVHQRRPFAAADIIHGLAHGLVGRNEIVAVNLLAKQSRKAGKQMRDISARGLRLHGHGDGVAVVFHQHQHRQPVQAHHVHGFPKLAFAGRAIADR